MSRMYLPGLSEQQELRRHLRDLAVPDRRLAAAQALTAAGAAAVPHLLTRLNHADEPVRAAVHDALVRIGEPAVGPLCAVLQEWNHPSCRAALAVLGRLKHPGAVEPLCRLLADPSPKLRLAARETLGGFPVSIAPGLCRIWVNAPYALREQLSLVLNELGEGAAQPLCALLSDPDPTLRMCAAYQLGRRGDRCAIDLLKRRLSDPSARVRTQVAIVLGQLREKSAAAHLLTALTDPAPEVRAAAADALGELGDPASVVPLLKHAAHPLQREAALLALCRLAGVRHVELGSSHARPAIRVLSDGPTIYFLCHCLDAEHRAESAAAARLLAGIALHAPLPELRLALPLLERQLSGWWSGDVSTDRLARFTIRSIENATLGMRDLPIPASGRATEPQTLPLPSGAPTPLSEALPLPSRDSPTPTSPPSSNSTPSSNSNSRPPAHPHPARRP